MKVIMNKLELKHIMIIVILVVLLYWLILPNEKSNITDVQKLQDQEVRNHHSHSQNTEVTKNKEEEEMKRILDEKEAEIVTLHSEVDELKQHEKELIKSNNERLKTVQYKASDDTERLQKLVDEKEKIISTHAKAMKDLDDKIVEISKKSDLIEKKNAELTAKSKLVEKIVTVTSKPLKPVETKPFLGLKLVHLDLKGAPPKIDYLIDFLKQSKKLGANGIVIEYEDMFPWKDELSILARENAYTEDDIREILTAANDEGLLVIPLVQTFGHLEFALKHKSFSSLRANKEMSNSVSSLNNRSVSFVTKLIDQVLELHPNSKWIHLGGDEVWNIKACNGCLNASVASLFTHHMKPVFQHVKSKKTDNGDSIKPIIWDDMMRHWDTDKLKEMSKLVSPMVWAYVANLATYHNFPEGMWSRYASVFPEIWLASSFKGALKPWSNFVPIRQHLENHLSWLKITTDLQQKGVKVTGIALTGWSRFDHYGPLCEILPAGIPCLALCLEVLNKGSFTEELHMNVSKQLGFNGTFKIDIPQFKRYEPEQANFLGSDVYKLVGLVEKAIGWKDWSSVREIGWTRPFQTEKKFISFFALNSTIMGLSKSNDLLQQAKKIAPGILSTYFEDYVVNEWITDKIDYHIDSAKHSQNKVETIMKKVVF